MTKEEAIKIIKTECYVFNPLNFDRSIRINTALDMMVNDFKREPKVGRWIIDGTSDIKAPLEDGCTTISCYCSECGEWLVASDEYSCWGKYCPSCGITMEG